MNTQPVPPVQTIFVDVPDTSSYKNWVNQLNISHVDLDPGKHTLPQGPSRNMIVTKLIAEILWSVLILMILFLGIASALWQSNTTSANDFRTGAEVIVKVAGAIVLPAFVTDLALHLMLNRDWREDQSRMENCLPSLISPREHQRRQQETAAAQPADGNIHKLVADIEDLVFSQTNQHVFRDGRDGSFTPAANQLVELLTEKIGK